jgi:N-acetylmuramoyl-L-alanine amidase
MVFSQFLEVNLFFRYKTWTQNYKNTLLMEEKRTNYIRNCAMFLLIFFLGSFFSFSQTEEMIRPTIKTVVIDAGHGGKDPGCHGAYAQEKHVCLSMALKLGGLIKQNYPDINVIYTRDKDVFVELDERAKIANRNAADLFICIHANAAGEVVFGAETYVLGLHKTEAQQLIAERENSIIYTEEDGGDKYKDFNLAPDAIIARQIQLSTFLDQSISFASKLQGEFKKIGRSDRGVKQAGFIVLYKTTMPSVLIETGFLTNKKEEVFLSDSSSQKKMAGAMFTAFESYKNELEGVDVKTTVINTPPVENKTKPSGIEKTDGKNTSYSSTNSSNSPSATKSEKDKIIFRVQIETSDKKIPIKDPRFKGLEIYEYQQDKVFKYTSGQFIDDFKGASNYKNELKNKGFQGAFIVAFLNGERINIEKAIKLAEK